MIGLLIFFASPDRDACAGARPRMARGLQPLLAPREETSSKP